MGTLSKLVVITLLFSLLSTPPATMANDRSALRLALIHRLKLDEESTNCWDSLIQLQGCSGELVMFFLNGETYLGDGCCEAIRVIGKRCWPNLMGTLGFTAEEGNVLEGYCEGEAEEEPNADDKMVPAKKSLVP